MNLRLFRILLDPLATEGGGGEFSVSEFESGGITPEAADPPASSTSSPSPTPAAGTTPGTPAQPTEPLSIRGLVGSLGLELPEEIGDDYSALAYLSQQAALARQLQSQQQQGDVFAQLGRQLAPRAPEIQRYLQQGQQAAQPQRRPYEPPPFDDRWGALLKSDPHTGMYVAVHPNVPQSIVDAANEYREWTANFMRNPLETYRQFSEDRERELVEQRLPQLVQSAIQQFQTQQRVNDIARQNAPWFYARDTEGNFLPDVMTGGYKVSPLGRQYLEAVAWAAGQGVKDPVARDQFARSMLRHEIAGATAPAEGEVPIAGPPTNAQTAAQRQGRALPNSRPRQNPLQALGHVERAETPGATEPQTISFADTMRRRLAEAGINDEHLRAEGAFG